MATHPAAWARRDEVFNAITGVAALEPIFAAVFAPTPIAALTAEYNAINTVAIGNAVAGPPALAAIPAADVPNAAGMHTLKKKFFFERRCFGAFQNARARLVIRQMVANGLSSLVDTIECFPTAAELRDLDFPAQEVTVLLRIKNHDAKEASARALVNARARKKNPVRVVNVPARIAALGLGLLPDTLKPTAETVRVVLLRSEETGGRPFPFMEVKCEPWLDPTWHTFKKNQQSETSGGALGDLGTVQLEALETLGSVEKLQKEAALEGAARMKKLHLPWQAYMASMRK